MQNNLYTKDSIGLLFAKTNNSTPLNPIATNLQKKILFFLFFLFITNFTFAANSTTTGFFTSKVESLVKQLEVVSARQSFSVDASPITRVGTDCNKNIPGSGSSTHVILSVLNIPESGTIEDINIKNLDITHTWINDLRVTLTGPDGTSAIVINQICNSEDNMLLNLDDEATIVNFPTCPPTNSGNYRPANPLSIFDGKEINGDWTLRVEDTYPSEDGGTFNCWALEFETASAVVAEICNNNIDDDGDGLIDCADSDCPSNCSSLECADGVILLGSKTASAIGSGNSGIPTINDFYIPAGNNRIIFVVANFEREHCQNGDNCTDSNSTGSGLGDNFASPNFLTDNPQLTARFTGTSSIDKMNPLTLPDGDLRFMYQTGFPDPPGVNSASFYSRESYFIALYESDINAILGGNAAGNVNITLPDVTTPIDNADEAILMAYTFANIQQDASGIVRSGVNTNDNYVNANSGGIGGDFTITDSDFDNGQEPNQIEDGVFVVGFNGMENSGFNTINGFNTIDDVTVNNINGDYSIFNEPDGFSMSTQFRNGPSSGTIDNLTIQSSGAASPLSNGGMFAVFTLEACSNTTEICPNFLTNEEFDNGTNDWSLHVDQSTSSSATWNINNTNQLSGTNAAYVNITNASGTSWDIELLQDNQSIAAGKEYQVVFEAKAVGERDMVVAVQQNSGDWDTYGSQLVNLTTELQIYSFKFIAPVTNTGGIAVIFHVGKSSENIYIDNVRFSEACVAEICDNNIDDDGDGLIDNADSDCSGTVVCTACTSNNLFDNPSFETGTWSGSETFVTGVFATNLTNEPSDPLDSWGYNDAKWVESNKATDGNRFVYLNKDTDESVCFSQLYTFGDGNEINDCDTYQVCFDWASFNNDFVNGRTTYSQPSVDFIFRDNADQKLKFVSVPLGEATANQNWNNLTWESLSFSFKFEGNLTVPANTSSIKVFISERDDYNNGLLLDNTSFCLINSCSDECKLITTTEHASAQTWIGEDNVWVRHDVDNDMQLHHNNDGTMTIQGNVIDGISEGGIPCGTTDGWFVDITLSNKKDWATWNGNYDTYNVDNGICSDNHTSFDYWDVTGTLTGTGCNAGELYPIIGNQVGYQVQVGYGASRGTCDFGMAGWTIFDENGTDKVFDIYFLLEESCYNKPNACVLQFNNVVVSNCINHPLMDVATLDVEISWTDAPPNDSIVVQIANQTVYIAVANGVSSPQVVQFTVPADGSTNNNINVSWKNTSGCEGNSTYNNPTACSNDKISCDILYICGDDKPYDGDAWDHGWLEYLDAVNGDNVLTPAFSKNDANGIGLYDPHNTNNVLAINFRDYDLIIVSATTEGRLSNDIIDSLAITPVSVLNSNINIYNDLGMTASEGGVAWQSNAFVDNTTAVDIYNFNNKITPWNGQVLLTGDYHNNADVYLWEGAGDAASGVEGVLFTYTADDVLPSISNHGNRVFLGYHMNGFYANNSNGGTVPTPSSAWFEPAKHLTLIGKTHFDVALKLASASCNSATNSCPLTNIYPGFPIDFLNDNSGWVDYNLVNDLELIDNGDGTKTISGSINNGTPVDFGSGMNGTSCGSNDGWTMNLTLSDKMDWTTFQAAGGSANVHANCNAQIASLDYWDVSGTLTGTGCNAGRTLTVNGPKAPYRLQIGYGGNNGDAACDFGMSTWFDIEENGTQLNADIYAFLEENCYISGNCGTVDIAALDGSTDAITDFNNANVTIGDAIITIAPTTFSGTATIDEYGINDNHETGSYGLQLGVNSTGGANYLESIYDFSVPVENFNGRILDIDYSDAIRVYGRRNGVAVPFSISNQGACVNYDGANTFNSTCFSNGNPTNSNDYAFEITFNDTIDQIVFQSFDPGPNTGGSFTFVISPSISCSVEEEPPLDKDVCYLIADGDGDGWMVPDTFYTFNHLTGAVTPIGLTGTMNIEAMALDTVNYIIYTADGNDFGVIDIATGVFTAINTNMGSINGAEGSHNVTDLDGMTYDYTNNIIWATARASGIDGLPDDLLLKIDPATGTPIANSFGAGIDYLTVNTNENDLDDIAMAADGTLYAISNLGSSGNQRLGIINKTTGAWTEIGDYGIEDVESLTFTAKGQLLATTGEDGDHQNSLYSIDASTAEATYVGSILPAQDVEACVCNFGNFIDLQIGDKVWADIDADGIQDIGEPGVKDVTVNLLHENGTPYLDATNTPVTSNTDIYGIYNFGGLSPGNYMVEFELPTGTSFSNKDIGGDDTKDSDADAVTGRTGIITLAGSINNRDADAGILNANVVVRDCDDAGELFVVDELGGAILRFNSTTGTLIDTFIIGLSTPKEMIVGADDYLYVSDAGLNEVRRYSLITGALIDVLARNLKAPNGMTFDANGMLYVNNKSKDEVLKIDPSNGTIAVFVTEQSGGLDSNNGGIEFGPDGNLYVASRTTDEVLRFNGTTGAFIDVFVSAGSGTLNGPDDLVFGVDGRLYVVSSYSDQVKRYNGTTGAYIDDFVTYRSGGLRAPRSLTFGTDNNIYVSGQTSPDGVYRYNELTGAFVDLFATGLADPRGMLFAPVPNCDDCCAQINYANNSLENGNFSSFTSNSNPNGTATLTTFGGSDAVEWSPSGGFGTNGSPITDFGANPGYWIDASTNGGAGSLDGNRFYWLEPRNSAGGSDCLGAVSGGDLLGSFCQGSTVEICGYVAAYDPNNINNGTVNTDFVFEIYTNNGNDPADFITTPTGTSSINDNGGNNESFTLPLPASTTILDITGASFTGANGQVADWRTLNWQSICFQVTLKEDQSNYSSIVFSMADGSDGMAIDNLSIRDVSTPDAGRDTTLYICSETIDLNNAQSGEIWSKISEPAGATASIDANTGIVTGLTENGEYKFLLAKTAIAACQDTIRVLIDCNREICDNNMDDDGDGLIDCEDPDCQVANITNLSFSNCVLVGNDFQSTLSVEVEWSNPPAGENLIVGANNTTQTIDIVGGATSPAIVEFTITADNSQNNPISIDYSGGSGCSLNATYNAPAPCPDPTDRNAPCDNSSGHVGGIVFEDLNSDGLQDSGEPGLAGILVTATDSTGSTVGQTITNNIGVFQFETLTNGIKVRLEFTAIPSGMYPTNAAIFKGTTVQFEQVPSCDAALGLIDPTENPCDVIINGSLLNGYALVSTLPGADNITLAVKDLTQLGTLWQTAGNRNTNQAGSVSTFRTWTTADFEGAAIFSTTIDPKKETIYAIASPLHGSAENTESILFETAIAPKIFKIDAETGAVSRIAELSGTLGLGYIDFDAVHEQLFVTNMDDGKIYRLSTDGTILSSFDPLSADDGIIGQLPTLGDRVMGVAFNPINKRVYYSVWANHYDRTNVSSNVTATFNTIRSVALDANGAFIPSSDQLEITMPYGASGFNLTTPVGDIEFNRAGDKVLLAEIPLGENTATNQITTASYIGVLREYQLTSGTWTMETVYGSNNESKYDMGNQTFYKGRNSRGGAAWAYGSITDNTINGDDSYIVATGDALHITAIEGDNIFGLQFMPSTGANIANSILIDLDNDLTNENLYAYGDIDVYKDYCANLSLEIGNYVWLDEDEDGVQDPNEFGMEGINVTLYNAAGDSLTTVVTNADGEYYFSDINHGLMPNTTYYIVIGRGGQFDITLGVLNEVNNLTTLDLGVGNYADLNDSDGRIATIANGQPAIIEDYPFIEVQTGTVGQNDYSLDFGFRQVCSAAFVVNDSLVLCPRTDYEGSVAVNDKNYSDKNFSAITQPTSGTVTMNSDGTFMYTNTTSTCETDEFRYQVCDETNVCCVTAVVHLNFNDTTKPTLANVPANDTISCDELIPLPPQIFARDNCPRISLNVQEESTQGEDGCSLYDYTITRTWTVTDQCGNSTSAAQIVEVQDIVAPDIYRIYNLPNGKKMVAGVMELVGENWKTINLPIDFDTKPVILHQVVTSDANIPVVSQIQNVSVSQFELRIKSEEAHSTKLTRKSIAWIAVEAGAQLTDYQLDVNTLLVSETSQAVNFQNAFAAAPALFVSSQTTDELDPFTIRQDGVTATGATLNLQEEASNDVELTHTDERIGYLAIEKLGSLREAKGVLIGEVGTLTVNSNWTTVNLNHTYHNPVIIANSLSNIDGEAATVSIRNVGLDQFEISINEWAYLNGTHSNETISYIVIEGSIPLESPDYCDTGTDSLDVSVDFKAVDNCDVSVVINYVEKDTFIGATKIITRTWSAEDECGNATAYSQEISCEGVSLQIKSILQGAMLSNNGDGLMRDDLRRKNLLPMKEPYTEIDRFKHVASGGDEVITDATILADNGANSIVDWVFLELRDANDVDNVIATKSALIQRDGDVVTIQGDTIIHFTNTRVGNYYVAVRHRNHLGIISLNTFTFSPSEVPMVDFTFTFTPVVGDHSSVEVDNLESLWSGDLNSDGKVIYQGPNNDIFFMFLHVLKDGGNKDFLPNYISRSYTNDDFNLDGSVIYQGPNNDRANLLFNTILKHPDNPNKFSNFIIYSGDN